MSAPVEFTVWAPLPGRVRIQVDGAVHDMTREDGGWWRARGRGAARRPTTASCSTTATRPAGPALAPAARGRARPLPAVRPGHLRVGRRRVDRPPARRRRSSTSCTSARSRPRARWTPRSAGSATSSGSASTSSSCCRSTRSTARTTGATTASSGTPSRRPTAAPRPTSGSSTPATSRGSASSRTSSTTTSGRPGTTCPSSSRSSPRAAPTPGATSINLSGPDSDEVRRYVIDNALMWLRDMHVDGLRLDAVHALVDERATHVLEEMAQEVDKLSVAVGRPLSADRRERPQRPAAWSPRGSPAAWA